MALLADPPGGASVSLGESGDRPVASSSNRSLRAWGGKEGCGETARSAHTPPLRRTPSGRPRRPPDTPVPGIGRQARDRRYLCRALLRLRSEFIGENRLRLTTELYEALRRTLSGFPGMANAFLTLSVCNFLLCNNLTSRNSDVNKLCACHLVGLGISVNHPNSEIQK